MKKYNVELKAECEVSFADPEKAYSFFIEGDWKDSFYTFGDLEDLAGFLAINFINNGGQIEGFRDFEYNDNMYESKDEESGSIFIDVTGDLDVEYVTEIINE